MQTEQLKCVDSEGLRVELVREGSMFRVNIKDVEGFERTRIFTDYAEADALFRSYLQGS